MRLHLCRRQVCLRQAQLAASRLSIRRGTEQGGSEGVAQHACHQFSWSEVTTATVARPGSQRARGVGRCKERKCHVGNGSCASAQSDLRSWSITAHMWHPLRSPCHHRQNRPEACRLPCFDS